MSTATVNPDKQASPAPFTRECRVYERYPSDLATQCQPLAARGENDMKWQATVRDISLGGMGLILQRRFEPRTGLAIELPDSDDSLFTVFVRVVHATAQAGGRWLLGGQWFVDCTFVVPPSTDLIKSLDKKH